MKERKRREERERRRQGEREWEMRAHSRSGAWKRAIGEVTGWWRGCVIVLVLAERRERMAGTEERVGRGEVQRDRERRAMRYEEVLESWTERENEHEWK